ncbi:MAG: N-6 DNA methylase [Candidatus Aminicenantes bacterium]
MNRMDQLFKKLGYERSKGLFYLEDADKWMDKFPYRIGRVLKDIIRPYAFYSPFHGETSTDREHPEPLNNPIILFFDHPDEEVEQNIPRWTFSFSQAPIVIINKDDYSPLEIYHGYNFDNKEQKWLKKIDDSDTNVLDFSISDLSTGRTWEKLYEKYFKNTPRVDDYLLKNIIDARRILIAKNKGGLSTKTANRLIGRLLFIRYLIDRNVDIEYNRLICGTDKEERRKSFENLLKDKQKIYCLFRYITEKFNGDLFPMEEKDGKGQEIYEEETEVEQRHLDVMYYLFTCSEFFEDDRTWEGYFVQKSLFDFYDFEVIPVELISNIYENFLRESEIENLGAMPSSLQKQIKAYYTPPFLVDYVLSQTVSPHLDKMGKASCKVLDPACGSGIFLVETTRKLIEKEMQINPVLTPDNKPMIPDKRLWELIRENIFGIDIDSEAIEITIFSLYITLLDYKTPKEIKSFRFERLKNVNLFGGKEADFFNQVHPFNDLFMNKINLDFIIGNPPWGKSPGTLFSTYIENRRKKEEQESSSKNVKLEIDQDEISQAFMVRISDFSFSRKTRLPKCVFVVTGKNFYNTSGKVKVWRSYFLHKFHVARFFELTSVNTKIVGGKQIFKSARQPAVIVSFSPATPTGDTANNIVQHITVRPNLFFNYFKTLVIEKQDVKRIRQGYFMSCDWLWKVLLHGNVLDFHFVKRLKKDFKTFGRIMREKNLVSMRGLQPKFKASTGKEKIDTDAYLDWDYLEIDKRREFQPYFLGPTSKWRQKRKGLIAEGKINPDGKIGRLPDIHFFKGKKLLIKRGLQAGNNFKAVTAFSEKNLLYSDSVCGIKPHQGTNLTDELELLLKTAVGLMNSNFFTYFLLSTGTSLGVDRTRADLEEFLSIPMVPSKKISKRVDEIQMRYRSLNKTGFFESKQNKLKQEIDTLLEEIEQIIAEIYNISDREKALIDYAIEVAIPVLKREGIRKSHSSSAFNVLSLDKQKDKEYLRQYAQVFIDHFGGRFNDKEKYFVVDIHLTSSFIGFHFKITKKPHPHERVFFVKCAGIEEMVNRIGELGYHKLSKDLYIRQDIRGFNKTSFYVIKSNQRKSWHKAVAYADMSDFIRDLVKEEIKRKSA